MNIIQTSAWVLRSKNDRQEAILVKKDITFTDCSDGEVIAAPLYGCMEGNYTHALQLKPDNIFKRRDEDEIVLGNSGVVEVMKVGNSVMSLKPGDLCIIFGNGESDDYGYTTKTTAFDKKDSMGVFAKLIKINKNELIKIPKHSKASLKQWAAFSVKYISAWSNWKVAYQSWKIQMPDVKPEDTYVFGWGGGTAFAELMLAKQYGCECFMLTSKKDRLRFIEENGIGGIDRGVNSKEQILSYINEVTKGRGVSIFIDHIGKPVYEMSLRALGEHGVIATTGWKEGGFLPISRSDECKGRHIHVFTHYASYKEGIEAVQFAEDNKWFPPLSNEEYEWNDLPNLLRLYSDNHFSSWFPIFKINDRGKNI